MMHGWLFKSTRLALDWRYHCSQQIKEDAELLIIRIFLHINKIYVCKIEQLQTKTNAQR